MDVDLSEFAIWLRQRAAAAGYDLDARGSLSALAKAAGTDIGQTSRAFRSQAHPSPETLRSLAKALGVSVVEMFVKAGVIRPEDVAELLPSGDEDFSRYPAPTREVLDLRSVGTQMGVRPESLDQWAKVVTAVTEVFEDGK